ncbi:ribonuclease HI family protein [uncultured Limosilactobacillus sp.]|uniref:ribonuclease HI family protein n=1 Tax=uncultured Limosilactobacillus sp. TaxID=2837629 RepID=UPI00260090F8|nr:ribonuclease HI family protein [uncultured Limosilactobacillus sp.]
MISIYTDAATKGNPGPTGLGILIIVNKQQFQLTSTIDLANNHEGEFQAAIAGFRYLTAHFTAQEVVLFHTDSQLVKDAVSKRYAKHYSPELATLLSLMDQFETVITRWIPEKENHGAHHLANQALHQLE